MSGARAADGILERGAALTRDERTKFIGQGSDCLGNISGRSGSTRPILCGKGHFWARDDGVRARIWPIPGA